MVRSRSKRIINKYYEDLYKEEREKNVDLQKQLNELKSTNQSATKEKHSRPISANKHGRTLQEKQIQNLVDEVIEEQAELEPEEVNTLEKEGEYNNPVKFKEIKHAVLKIRYQLQQNNIYDIKDISKQISMTLNEFSTFLHTNFALTEKDSILIARLIFEEDSKHHNGKILLNKEKSCLTNKIFTTLKSFINLQDKIKVNN